MHLYERKRGKNRGLLAAILVFLAVAALLLASLAFASRRNEAEEAALLESALQRAVVTCYAVEGRYPPSLDYIYENYGVSVDTDRYAIYYDIFASNVMPTIVVTPIGGGGE